MKYRLNAMLALALTLTLVIATRAADDKPLETPFYPLKAGSVWQYKIGDHKVTMTVTKYEEFEKQLSARVETSATGNAPAFEHIVVKDDGVYRIGFANTKVDPPVKFLQLPPEKGQTWNIKTMMGADTLTGTFKIDMVDQVVVPAGTYKNVYTSTFDGEASGNKINFTYYFAKGVGMVKQVFKAGGQEVAIELEKFEPGK